MIHKEIPDAQRSTAIAPQLSKPAKTGRPRRDDRTTINGVLFALATGCRRADMPDKCGSKPTVHLRFRELRQKGIWKRILSGLIKSVHKQGRTDLQKISIDSPPIAAKKGAMKQDMTDSGKFWARRFMSQRIRRDCRSQHDSAKFIDVLEDISELADNNLGRAIASALQVRIMMQNTSETI